MEFPRPLVIQSDLSLLLEVSHPDYESVRNFLASFAELVKSPEYIHSYKISPLSLWNAASAKINLPSIIDGLTNWSRYKIADSVIQTIGDWYNRFGLLVLDRINGQEDVFLLTCNDNELIHTLLSSNQVRGLIEQTKIPNQFFVPLFVRGTLKQLFIEKGYPVYDRCGFVTGKSLDVQIRKTCLDGTEFKIRDYQKEASDIFYLDGVPAGGHGVIVLPCGSGKTVVGMLCISKVKENTLILCPNVMAVKQWKREILNRTFLTEDDVGEYTGEIKEIKAITIATYQVVVYRPNKKEGFPHFNLLTDYPWGLIIYDEVHLLPAPIFRVTAEIQARRRLGLTATLIREDGKETNVFALIGPKRYDIPWKVMEQQGWIAKAECIEVRVPLPKDKRIEYAKAGKKARIRIAAENSLKDQVAYEILKLYPDEPVLIIGHYIKQIKKLSKRLDAPLITGQTTDKKREELYDRFRSGDVPVLVVSRVANFAIDLPDASIAIEVSGIYGSRQEEAQRLGRILRPKDKTSMFYSLVTKDTVDQDFGHHRQMFLTEQGYQYKLEEWELENLISLQNKLKDDDSEESDEDDETTEEDLIEIGE